LHSGGKTGIEPSKGSHMKSLAEGNESRGSVLQSVTGLVQVISVLVAAVISILSFNNVRNKEVEARKAEATKHDVEAARPFLELRSKRYLETLEVVSVLGTGKPRGEMDISAARPRFEQLYWVELAMVEDDGVETAMVRLRNALDCLDATKKQDEATCKRDEAKREQEKQQATLGVAHAIRDSMAQSWGLRKPLDQ
jgi:hypothetical protein